MTSRTTFFANGCFDVLHSGHFAFLRFCLETADKNNGILLLGIDSDSKISLDKGRASIFSFKERKEQLLTLFSEIAGIFPFDNSKDLKDLIQYPESIILIKGKEWEGNVIGEEYADKVIYYERRRIFPSTSEIIRRITNANKKRI